MKAEYAHYLIFGASILALLYATYCFWSIHKLLMTKEAVKVHQLSDRERDELMASQHARMPPQTQEEAFELMLKVSGLI